MTNLLQQAVEAMRQLPPATQDSLAQAILSIAQGGAHDEIAPEHLPYVLEGLAQLARGEVATEGEVAEAFRAFEA